MNESPGRDGDDHTLDDASPQGSIVVETDTVMEPDVASELAVVRVENAAVPIPARGAAWARTVVPAFAAAVLIGGGVTLAVLTIQGKAQESARPAVQPSAVMVPAAAVEHEPAASPKWKHAEEWVGDHPKSIAFELAAEHKVAVWMKHVTPVLVVRCLARNTEVFVVTESAASIETQGFNHTVRVGFDDEDATAEHWDDSADRDALFAHDGVALARRIARARTMRFGFTPQNALPAVAEFDVRGFDAVLGEVAQTCHWR
jgi:hypothetical protein